MHKKPAAKSKPASDAKKPAPKREASGPRDTESYVYGQNRRGKAAGY